MSFELQHTDEEVPAALLQEFQNSGNYLFHGSPVSIDKLEPRLPKGDLSEKVFNKTESIYATSSAARAVVSAIMPKGKGIEWGTFQDSEGNITLNCTKAVLEQVQPGFVLVLGEKNKAIKDEEGGSTQYKYNEPRVPLLKIPVTFDDFKALGGKVELTP